jgi:cell division protein FtsQ
LHNGFVSIIITMKRFLVIVVSLLFWAAVVFYMVWSSDMSRRRRSGVVVGELVITVSDSARLGLVTSDMVEGWIMQDGLYPVGKPVAEVSAGRLRRAVLGRGSAAGAVVYIDLAGTVNISLFQHTPVARVITGSGYDFFLLHGGHILPRQGYAAQYVPVITGDFALPFGREFAGDVHSYALAEEKKSDKNYIFLCKLINFAEYIWGSEFWRSQIVQINVPEAGRWSGADNLMGGGNGAVSNPESGGMFYREPEVELIPRAGDHIIVLGRLDGFETKLDNMALFYSQAVPAEGWGKWSRIILKYDNQIVCK